MPQNPPSATTPAEQHAEGVPERILVVEDDTVIRALVTTTLESRGISFLTAATGREALAEASRANPDVILLDLGLPDMDGREVVRRLREWCNTPIIILTAHNQEDEKIKTLDAGADDYLTKPFSPRELTMRVKSVLKRSRPSENTIRLEHEMLLHLDRRTITKNCVEVKLTPNEYSILLCLANNAKALVSRDKLVEYINSPDALDRTVDVHVRHLRQKLEDDPKNPQIIKTVHGHGYILGVKRHA